MSGNGTLTVYERMTDPLAAVKQLGSSIAKSGMFGCPSVEAGEVFAMECLARRMPPLMLAERYHVIFGKLSMKAEAMLAGFEAEGGKYKVLSRTPELASIEMSIGGQIHTLSLSWEEAQKEPFVYEGKEGDVLKALAAGNKPALKAKYSTPRSRMQMLWARLVSDGVRFLCPRVVSGVYTPEELGDGDDEPTATAGSNGNGQHKPAPPSVVDQAEAAAKARAQDAEFEVKHETQSAATSSPQLITPEQKQRLDELTVALQCGDKINAALAKRKLGSIRELESSDATKIIERLEAELAAKRLPNEPPFETRTATQATPEEIQRIKSSLAEWAQIDADGYKREVDRLKQKLSDSGKQMLADISSHDAARLLNCVQAKKLDAFIQHSLEDWKPKSEVPASGN